MSTDKKNISIVENKLTREAKERLLAQKGIVIWLLGLSGSGKSTIALELEKRLYAEKYYTKFIDGDDLRFGLTKDLGFTENDRNENIRRAAEVAKLFYENGAVVICSFITPFYTQQDQLKSILGDDLVLVYVKCSIEECEKRDVKGLYKKVRNGEIKNFTGIDSPFEYPKDVHVIIDTEQLTIAQSVDILFQYVKPKIVNRG